MKRHSLTRKKLLRNFLVFFMILCPAIKANESNMHLIDSLLIEYLTTELAGLGTNGDSIAIYSDLIDADSENYLRFRLADLLHRKSFRVFRNYNQVPAFQGVVIDIQEFEPIVEYSVPFNQTPLSEAQERREITLIIAGQIYKASDGMILKSLDNEVSFADTVFVSNLQSREVSPYRFTKGKRIKYSSWEIYFEPLLIISTAGVIVYLFFSQRF
jgi:hypothetical protein